MPRLQEISFFKDIIADKIGVCLTGYMWAAVMGQELYVFNGDAHRKFPISQTYRSPIGFESEQLVRCHEELIHLGDGQVVKRDLVAICASPGGDMISGLHACTNVAWTSGGDALAAFRYFPPRGGSQSTGALTNYLLLVAGRGDARSCTKLAEHPSNPFDCIYAGRRYIAAFANKLMLWEHGKPVTHALRTEQGLAMDYIFFTEDEKEMFLVSAVGKVTVVNTATWKPEGAFTLEHYSSMHRAALSSDGTLFATGNNEGDCYVYKRDDGQFGKLLYHKFSGIITALAFNNARELIIGVSGATQRGTGIFKIVE